MYYSDKPIDLEQNDRLGRNSFAKLLAKSILNLNNQDTFSVGLFGKWGSGKTSIVNMMLHEIELNQQTLPENEKFIVIRFEPWNFSNTNQLLTQFFIRLSNEFRSIQDENLTKIGEALEKYADAFELLNSIPYIGNILSFLGKKGAEEVGSKLKNSIEEQDILKQKEFVINLLEKQSNKILVIIDDIDRLSDEQIRQVFQLVTSVAKFPNTIYLLVFDKDIVVKALEKVQEGSGEDYLEKIIQMPIQIPNAQPEKIRQILLERLEVFLLEYEGIGFQKSHWQNIYESCIAQFMDSLRIVNRLCNTIQFKIASIYQEIDFADLVAISVLEIKLPEVYEWVKGNKPILTGELDVSLIGMSNKTQQDLYNIYFSQIKAVINSKEELAIDDKYVKGVISFLAYLFPYFGYKIGEIHGVYDFNLFRKCNQIAHPEKFDRYFSLDLDEIIIKKSEIKNAVFDASSDSLIDIILRQDDKGNSYDFFKEMQVLFPEILPDRAKIIINALLKVYPELSTEPQNNFLSLPAISLVGYLIIDLLDIINSVDRFNYICNIINTSDVFVLPIIAEVINTIELAYGRFSDDGERHSSKKIISLNELIQVENVFVEKAKQIFIGCNLFDSDRWRIVLGMLERFVPDYTKEYLEQLFVDDKNIVRYLFDSVTVWIGNGKEYEVTNSYKKYLTEESILKAIESLKSSKVLFSMSSDTQNRCAAFYINVTTKDNNISQIAVEQLLSFWKEE